MTLTSRSVCEEKRFDEFIMCLQSHKVSVMAGAQQSTLHNHPCIALLQKDLLQCASPNPVKTSPVAKKPTKK